MAKEIERKFLVADDSWRKGATGKPYCQGYIATAQADQSVRVRIAGERGYLTIKGPPQGLTRAEFEYEIPLGDAQAMLETLCQRPFIEKVRYRLPIGEVVWEIDEFEGANAGLIVAEIELQSEEQPFERPDWLGEEVSGQTRYYNSALVKQPYSEWP
ncbi:MAG: CYTH domain-containing protein [Cyanobacteria bacterium J06649_5]